MPNDKILREVNDRAFLSGLWKEAGVHTGRLAIGFFFDEENHLSEPADSGEERARSAPCKWCEWFCFLYVLWLGIGAEI